MRPDLPYALGRGPEGSEASANLRSRAHFVLQGRLSAPASDLLWRPHSQTTNDRVIVASAASTYVATATNTYIEFLMFNVVYSNQFEQLFAQRYGTHWGLQGDMPPMVSKECGCNVLCNRRAG